MSSNPDFELAFGKVDTCEICGDSTFMCECRYDIPEHDTFDDPYED